MEEFKKRVLAHIDHVNRVGQHCTTEETTKQALILPLLDILGFSPYDPTRVKAEYGADFPGVKAGERVDYALFCNAVPVMFVEAKAFGENLKNHAPQLSRYYNATPEVAVAAITNGREWRFFTDLNNKNVMDGEPFLTVDLTRPNPEAATSLSRFRHDQFQPDALRALAEESVYLAAFKGAIGSSLKDVDADFVRFIANRAQIQRQLNAKFIDSITPLVKQAVAQAVSEMVVSGLSAATPPAIEESITTPAQQLNALPTDGPIIDEANPRIVTTVAERRLFQLVKDIVGDAEDVHPKDTESYFAVLYQNKVNRWLLRYYGDKKNPFVQFAVDLTANHQAEIRRAGLSLGSSNNVLLSKPEDIMRLPGLLFDALAYCKDDNNFKVKKSEAQPA